MSALLNALLRAGLLAALAGAVVAFAALRGRRADPGGDAADGAPEERGLAYWRRRHEAALGRAPAEWEDCPCCGCPTLPAGEQDPECEVCGWDGEAYRLEEARACLNAYGFAFTPADAAAGDGSTPSAEERRIVRELRLMCAAAPAGRPPSAAFWTGLYGRLDALGAARLLRVTRWTG